jgi:tetraacyldisaccharide 4'-kinase
MLLLRFILTPLGLIWGLVAQIKRWCYEFFGLRKKATLPNIVVGNLSVGGSGKTPMILWLNHQLQQLGIKERHIGLLSRGYKRQSQGFLWVDDSKSVAEVGDEPAELFEALNGKGLLKITDTSSPTLQNDSLKMQEAVRPERTTESSHPQQAVCEDRWVGIETMKNESPILKLILLDDGFQHLRLNPTMGIVVCDYYKLFTHDWPMPSGRLREFPWAAQKAQAVFITNCPETLSDSDLQRKKEELTKSMVTWVRWNPFAGKDKNIQWENHIGFFSTIMSRPESPFNSGRFLTDEPTMLITGIANPHRVVDKLSQFNLMQHLRFSDHHNFDKKSVHKIVVAFENLRSTYPDLTAMTTRKDWVKIKFFWPADLPIFVISSSVKPLFNTESTIQNLLKKFIHENQIA